MRHLSGTLLPMTTRWWRRYAWLGTLIVLGGLYALVLITLVRTENPNLVPSVILLGATVVPVSFLVFAEGRTGRWQASPAVLVCTAFFGGVIGVVVAGWLEWDALRGLGTVLHTLWDSIGTELAYLVLSVVSVGSLLFAMRRYRALSL